MALKTPPIKTLGVAGLVRMAIDIDKDGLTHESKEEMDPAEEEKMFAEESQKSLTEVILLKLAAMFIKFAGVLMQYAEELAEIRKETYEANRRLDSSEDD